MIDLQEETRVQCRRCLWLNGYRWKLVIEAEEREERCREH